MDLSEIAKKLEISESKHLIRKAAELRRLCDVQFDSSIIGVVSFSSNPWIIERAHEFCVFDFEVVVSVMSEFVRDLQGEVCKAVICLEIAATR